MTFERPRDVGASASNVDLRPAQCPECGSKSLGTLAKVISVDTYWRCHSCGAVWNQTRQRAAGARRYGNR